MTLGAPVTATAGNVLLATAPNGTLTFQAGAVVTSLPGGTISLQTDTLAGIGGTAPPGSLNAGTTGTFELAPTTTPNVSLGAIVPGELSLLDLTGVTSDAIAEVRRITHGLRHHGPPNRHHHHGQHDRHRRDRLQRRNAHHPRPQSHRVAQPDRPPAEREHTDRRDQHDPDHRPHQFAKHHRPARRPAGRQPRTHRPERPHHQRHRRRRHEHESDHDQRLADPGGGRPRIRNHQHAHEHQRLDRHSKQCHGLRRHQHAHEHQRLDRRRQPPAPPPACRRRTAAWPSPAP